MKRFVIALAILGPMSAHWVEAGRDTTVTRIGSVDRVDASKKMLYFWYSKGEGKGKPGELNRAHEILTIAKDCKVTVDEKPGSWQLLREGDEVKVVSRGYVAYEIRARTSEYLVRLRKDQTRAEMELRKAEQNAAAKRKPPPPKVVPRQELDDHAKAALLDEAIRQWRASVPRRTSGWDQFDEMWRVAPPEVKDRVKKFAIDTGRGLLDNIKGAWNLSRDPDFLAKLAANEVRVKGKVVPSSCYVYWKGEGESGPAHKSLVGGDFTFVCQKNTTITIHVMRPGEIIGSKNGPYTFQRDTNIGTVTR